MISKKEIKVIILDIEGTTTSISFVADELFPYVRKNLENYLKQNWESEQVQDDIRQLRELSLEDVNQKRETVVIPNENKEEIISAVLKNVKQQMDIDRKSTALKNLQGHIWQKAYQTEEIKGHIFPDTFIALEQWKKIGIPVYIYSSGSIAAQKLLFGHSIKGNLLPFLSGHFDTTSGLKTESASYRTIFEAIQKQHPDLEMDQILFATDNILEAEAASTVKMNAILVDRPGNKPLPQNHPFLVANSLVDLQFFYSRNFDKTPPSHTHNDSLSK